MLTISTGFVFYFKLDEANVRYCQFQKISMWCQVTVGTVIVLHIFAILELPVHASIFFCFSLTVSFFILARLILLSSWSTFFLSRCCGSFCYPLSFSPSSLSLSVLFIPIFLSLCHTSVTVPGLNVFTSSYIHLLFSQRVLCPPKVIFVLSQFHWHLPPKSVSSVFWVPRIRR